MVQSQDQKNEKELNVVENVSFCFAEYMNQINIWAEAYNKELAPMTPEEFKDILDDIYYETI